MRVFLDLCLPKRLGRHLGEHECVHASREEWGESKNGRLIRAATDAGYDAMLTVDANMPFQTTLDADSLPVVVVIVRKNDLEHILPSIPRVLAALPRLLRGTYTIVPLLEERSEA